MSLLSTVSDPYASDIQLHLAQALVRFGTPYEREGDEELWRAEAEIAEFAFPVWPAHITLDDWCSEVLGQRVSYYRVRP